MFSIGVTSRDVTMTYFKGEDEGKAENGGRREREIMDGKGGKGIGGRISKGEINYKKKRRKEIRGETQKERGRQSDGESK